MTQPDGHVTPEKKDEIMASLKTISTAAPGEVMQQALAWYEYLLSERIRRKAANRTNSRSQRRVAHPSRVGEPKQRR